MGGLLTCLAGSICECACCCACTCCKSIFGGTLAQMTRIGHVVMVVVVFMVAIILGKSSPNEINGYDGYTGIMLDNQCIGAYKEECIYRQLVYRASFALFLVFGVIFLTSTFSEYVNRSFWVIKFFASFALFVGFWWGSNNFFAGWAEFCRYISFFWLLVQTVLFFDLAHDAHDVIMGAADEAEKEEGEGAGRKYLGLYLFLSLGSAVCGFVGIGYLYDDYSGCSLGAFFTTVTLLFGVGTTAVSLLNVVNKGLLTPCIMFAYSALLCWYGLLSNPDSACNPGANRNGSDEKDDGIVVVGVVTGLTLIYCAINGTLILNIFNPEGEGVITAHNHKASGALTSMLRGEENGSGSGSGSVTTRQPEDTEEGGESPAEDPHSGTAHERVFFHFIMMLLVCYGSMVLTNWGKTNGAPEGYGSQKTGDVSMWLKIISQWIFLILQCRVLHVAYMDNNENSF